MVLVLTKEEGKGKVQKLKTNSKFGPGFLYITNTSIIMEIPTSNLVCFQRNHSQIISVKALSKNKMEIIWEEKGDSQSFGFRLIDGNAPLHVKSLVEKYNYENNFIDILGINEVKLSDSQKNSILKKRLFFYNKKIKHCEREIKEVELKLAKLEQSDKDYEENKNNQTDLIRILKQDSLMWEKVKRDTNNIDINRHQNIPNEIPNENCWFDCWYDPKSKCYITFNIEFLKQYDFDSHESVKQYNKTNFLPNIKVIPEEFVGFVHGYPCILSRDVMKLFSSLFDKDEQIPDVILPNMTSEMLNDDLISKWHGISVNQNPDTEKYEKTPVTINYYTNKGSRVICTNNKRIRYCYKEIEFLRKRDALPERHREFIP